MKQKIFTRITSFILAVCIIVFTSFSYVTPVHATVPADTDIIQAFKRGTSTGDWTSFWDYIWTTGNVMQFLSSQIGAIMTKDFNTFMHNNDNFFKGAGNDWFTLDEDNNTLTANQACTVELKSAIEEYAEQNEPYRIMTTTPFHELPYSSFNNQKNVYDTVKNLISTSPVTLDIAVYSSSYKCACGNRGTYIGVSFFDNDSDIGYVSMKTSSYEQAMGYSFSKWTMQASNRHTATLVMCSEEDAFQNLDDFISHARKYGQNSPVAETVKAEFGYYNFPDSTGVTTAATFLSSYFKNLTDVRYFLNVYPRKTTLSLEHYRIFTTKDDFMDYTLGKRKVYYTSDWYDKEPGSITVDLSTLEDDVSDINKALEKLLDKIDDNTEESKIEELLKQILEELQNSDSGNTGGNTGGSTGGDSSGGGSVDLSGLSGYFESILDYLDKILQLQYIQTITQSEKDKFKEDTEKLLDENKSTFMEIANEMGKKFPFCIPADLAHLFSKLSGSSDAQTQALLNNSDPDYLMAVASGGGSSGGGSSGDIALASLGDSEVSVMAVEDSGVSVLRSSMDAPYFELPIIIESFGIDEKIEVDLEPFQPVSTFSRSMFSVLFAVALIKFTIHLIPLLSSSTD